MLLMALAVLILVSTGLLSAATCGRGNGVFAARSGVTGAVAGSVLAIIAAMQVVVTGRPWEAWTTWTTIIGPFSVGLDGLSSVFVILISGISALAAVYGRGYLSGHAADPRPGARSWCWFNILIASMILVVCARDGMTFLLSWEAMSLASFFLVMFDHEKPGVIKSAWIYLVTTHVGTAFLFFMFMFMGDGAALDFTSIVAAGRISGNGLVKTVVFIAAVIGFGTKAGFFPTHIWLPEAHPAAPSHVSAVMSGVMIKTGIYGLLRVLMLLGQPEAWWGWAFIVIGAATGIGGVIFALAQHDLKRLLAYSSIENVGIIVLGIGIGVLGVAYGNPITATLGFCGAILHTINHGVFKSLLFMGAGSVLHATGLRDIDKLGGLMRRMPVTGTMFMAGATAISALPPLNGFISEFLILSAAFSAITGKTSIGAGVMVILSLSLIGGLAVACFTKAAGIVFLGEPRSHEAANAHESPVTMLVPMAILAAVCVVIGLWAPRLIDSILPVVAGMTGLGGDPSLPISTTTLLVRVTTASGLLGLLLLLTALSRRAVLGGRERRDAPTWDCGYAAASPKVQYTASSFADPILLMFRSILRTKRQVQAPVGLFPKTASVRTWTSDVFLSRLYEPAVRTLVKASHQVQRLQQGSTHLYLLYIFITIIVLMIWNLQVRQ